MPKYTSANMHIQNGKWRGFLEYRDPDGRRRKKTRTLTATGKRAARAELERWRAEEEAKADEEERGPGAGADTPLYEAVRALIDSKEAAKAIEGSTVKGYNTTARYVLKMEGATVGNLTRETAQAWINDLAAEYSANTVKKARNLLKETMTEAVARGAARSNPLEGTKCPKLVSDNGNKNSLEPRDRARLLDECAAAGPSPVTVAIRLSLFMGLRIGEVCGLQWRDVDAEGRTLTVARSIAHDKNGKGYVKKPKTDRIRKLTMPAELAGALDEWREVQRGEWRETWGLEPNRDSYVIGDAMGWASAKSLEGEWRYIRKRLRLIGTTGKPPRFHDLRHTWATMMIGAGVDPVTCAMYLGHSKASMTMDVYATAGKEQIERAAATVGEVMRPTADGV